MIEDLSELAYFVDRAVVAEVEHAITEAAATGRSLTVGEVRCNLGLHGGAIERAGRYFIDALAPIDDKSAKAAVTFAQAWALGEREAMKRVAAAITMPAAKGREAEVVAALMAGASIEDAVAGSRQSPPESVTQRSNVVTLRRQQDTSLGG